MNLVQRTHIKNSPKITLKNLKKGETRAANSYQNNSPRITQKKKQKQNKTKTKTNKQTNNPTNKQTKTKLAQVPPNRRV